MAKCSWASAASRLRSWCEVMYFLVVELRASLCLVVCIVVTRARGSVCVCDSVLRVALVALLP